MHEGIEVLGPADELNDSLESPSLSPVNSNGFQCDMTLEDDDYSDYFDDESDCIPESDDFYEFADPCEMSNRPILLDQIRFCDDEQRLVPTITAAVTELFRKLCSQHGTKSAKRYFETRPRPACISPTIQSHIDYHLDEDLLGIRLCLDDLNPPRELAILLGIPPNPTWTAAVSAAFPPSHIGQRFLNLPPVSYHEAGKTMKGVLTSDDFLDTGSNEHCFVEAPCVRKLDVELPVHPTHCSDVAATADELQDESELDDPVVVTPLTDNPALLPQAVTATSSGSLSRSLPRHLVFGSAPISNGIPTLVGCGSSDTPIDPAPDLHSAVPLCPPDKEKVFLPDLFKPPGYSIARTLSASNFSGFRPDIQPVPPDSLSVCESMDSPPRLTHVETDTDIVQVLGTPTRLNTAACPLGYLLKNRFLPDSPLLGLVNKLLAQLEHPRERPGPTKDPTRTVLASFLTPPPLINASA
jgi:hypothetical protein